MKFSCCLFSNKPFVISEEQISNQVIQLVRKMNTPAPENTSTNELIAVNLKALTELIHGRVKEKKGYEFH